MLVGCDSCRAVATHSVCRKEISIAITTRCQDNAVCGKAFDCASNEVASDDTASAAVNHHNVEHLIASVELNSAFVHLTHQRGVCTQEELLAGLTFGVESTAHLHTTKRAVSQCAAVFASERNTLCHTLVDDACTYFSQTINISFASAIVATFHSVIEQAVNRVAVVLIVLCCIDTALCCNRVCTAGRILYAEVFHFEAHFAERCSGTGTCQTCTYDDNIELTFVFRVNELLMSLEIGPLFSNGTFGNL